MAILCPMATTTTECGRGMPRLILMLNTTTPDTTTAVLMDSTITNGMETNTMVKGGDNPKTNGTTNGGFDCLGRVDSFCLKAKGYNFLYLFAIETRIFR